jgi:RNAse (barnase) inhibitor barstar
LSIAKKFEFSNYFGMNLDAMDECLADLKYEGIEGFVVLIKNFNIFYNSNVKFANEVLSVFYDAAENWCNGNRVMNTNLEYEFKFIPFHIILNDYDYIDCRMQKNGFEIQELII